MPTIIEHAWAQAAALGILFVLLTGAVAVLWRYLTKMIASHKKECWQFAERVREGQDKSTTVLTQLSTLIESMDRRLNRS